MNDVDVECMKPNGNMQYIFHSRKV